MNRDKMQIRNSAPDLTTREDNGDLYLEGYFVVFNTSTELWPGVYEIIDPKAFDKTMSNDIRALINHDTTLVLGRNKAGTLELRIDTHGVWGRIKVNQKDTDAMNAYERAKRGDISGNSFGFNIVLEIPTYGEDGSVTFRLTEVDMHEVSVCTFPQYKETNIQARQEQVKQHEDRVIEAKKQQLRGKLANVKTAHA